MRLAVRTGHPGACAPRVGGIHRGRCRGQLCEWSLVLFSGAMSTPSSAKQNTSRAPSPPKTLELSGASSRSGRLPARTCARSPRPAAPAPGVAPGTAPAAGISAPTAGIAAPATGVAPAGTAPRAVIAPAPAAGAEAHAHVAPAGAVPRTLAPPCLGAGDRERTAEGEGACLGSARQRCGLI